MEKKKDNELFNFENVRVYQDENNVLHYNTRDVVRELGYERVHVDKRRSAPLKLIINLDGKDVSRNKYVNQDCTSTNGNKNEGLSNCHANCCTANVNEDCPPVGGWVDGNLQYREPRWDRVNNNLNKLGVPSLTEEQKNGYIPENIIYKLGFHGQTQKAIHFQNLVSDQILPHFRHNVDQEQLEKMNKKVTEYEEKLAMQQEAIDKRTEQYTSSLAHNYKLQDQLEDTINDLRQARSLKYNEELRNDRLRDEISELRGALEVIMKVASTKIEESY